MAPKIGDVYPGTNERIVGSIPGPTPGSLIYVGEMGGVFAPEGGFAGSYHSLEEKHRNDPNRRFTGIEARGGGGYTLRTNNPAEGYDFAPPAAVAPPTNPLLEDPAYLAFIRSSGMDLEAASADTDRQISAVRRALTGKIGDIEEQGQIGQRRISGGYESRGAFRSGDRLRAQREYDAQLARSKADLENTTATNINALRSNLTNKIAGTMRENAEKGAGVSGGRYGDFLGDQLKALTQGGEDEIAGMNRRLREYSY